MRAISLGAVLLAGILSCGRDDTGGGRDSVSQRQRDSAIGASALPGAGGVRGALRASDSAASRRAQEEAADQQP